MYTDLSLSGFCKHLFDKIFIDVSLNREKQQHESNYVMCSEVKQNASQ